MRFIVVTHIKNFEKQISISLFDSYSWFKIVEIKYIFLENLGRYPHGLVHFNSSNLQCVDKASNILAAHA